ncbi:sigma-70 family RNA polymerase sigma factor [Xenorhabdus kozodoii]|uniref:RNA polymerase sigma factor n=1 Tax=Xenorhabdus kozodoii TaxID=351676 RepID=A0A2D0LDV9_9GAMM|nr:sigma-70 family RNA polymerase sigma factor [Xenorhabdus kozodoii]PHM73852.1 RNA polymerase sigma factor [Xenorhabdus kozodoii]
MAVQKSTFEHNQITQKLYANYYHWLCNWIRQNSACSNQAEDIVHEVFIKLMQSSDLEHIRQPKAFLMTIARRTLSNHWRRKKLEDNHLEYLIENTEILANSSEDQHLLLEQLEKIDETLDELPVKVRQTFLLTQLQGLRYKEVAENLGISISSVKNYLHQAHRECHFFNTL